MRGRRLAIGSLMTVIFACAAQAIPTSFVGDEAVNGWISFGLRYFLPVGARSRGGVAFEFAGAGAQRIGIGFEIGRSGMGDEGFMIAVSGLYYADPFPSEYLTMPLKLRLGLAASGQAQSWFASASAGLLGFPFLLRYDDPDDPKEVGPTLGLDGELYYSGGRIYPAASALASIALRLGPNESGYYLINL